MGRARSAIDNLAGMFGNWPFLIQVLRQLDNDSPGGGPSVPSPSDVTNWTTYHVDETTGVDQTIAANPLRGQPGTPFRTIAFAINEFRTAYPLANNYNTWANQKFILNLGAGRFTAAVQGASIDVPLLRRTTAITGYGAVVESAIVFQNDKTAFAPDGNAFNAALVPAPWTGATYGATYGVQIVGLSSSDILSGDDQPGLTLLGRLTCDTLATAGQTLQPRLQVVRAWVQGGYHVNGANLSQSEVPLYAEDSVFGVQPSFGSVPTVVGCDGPPGLSAVSMLLSGKRSVFYDRIGPFVTFGDMEDCYFASIRNDLDFAGAPIAGVIRSANDGAFYNCVFVSPGRGDYGFVMGTSAEVSPLPFRADDNSLVSIASQTPTFDHMRSVGLDVSNLLHSYVAPTGSDVVSAPGISAVPYATIGAAIATAQDGTTIHVSPGSYASSAQWPAIAHLSIVGEDASNTRIFANLDAQPAFRVTTAAARGGRIANLTFEKTGITTTVGCVHVDNVTSDPAFLADGLLIENCVAERNQPGGAGAGMYYAWYINGASEVTMRGCAGGITETLNADFHAWDCEIIAQGDVPNALTVTGPVLGTLTRPWTGSHYHGCEIKGDDASLTPGVRLGGTPWIELDAGCFVSNTMQSVAPLVDANAGAQVPRVISRAYYFPNEISNTLQFACTTTEAYVDLSDAIFGTDDVTATVSDLALDAVGSTPRQHVNMQGMQTFSLTIGSKIDGDIRGGRYSVLSATLAAVTGATLNRDGIDRGGNLDGAGAAVITGLCPWPTGSFVEVYAQQQTVPGVVLGVTQANMVGPSAGGTLTLGTGTAGAAYSVSARVRRPT